MLNLSEIKCLVHIKYVGNSRTFLILQNLQTNHHADIELTQKCIYGTVLNLYFKNVCRLVYGKYYISVCMEISQLLVNFIPDHATKTLTFYS